MSDPDPLPLRLSAAIASAHAGDRPLARVRLGALWDELGPDGDPFHRCTLAHFMADVQDDPADALRWDLRALAAASELTEARVRAHHPALSLAGFLPSLHLNAAESFRKNGAFADARRHLALARTALEGQPDEGLARMIRQGLARLAARLGEE